MADPSPATILIVDDDEVKRYAIGRILRRAGFDLIEATSGGDALRLATERPDLIILDVNLPDINGFEVCRRIKADPATAVIPVLHVSATFVHSEDRVQGLDSGADGYLAETAEPPELVATVRALLRVRRAEEEARLLARQWQTTFDAIRDGVCLLDRAGRVVRSNRAMERIVGRPGDELVGLLLPALLPAAPDPDGESPVLRALRTGGREALDLTLGDRWLLVTADPIAGERGEVSGVVCTVADITERKRLEGELRWRVEELAEADRRKDELLAMLAHELRNPLAPILNALEVIRLDCSDSASVEQAREIARRQVRHMARLLDDLLDVARFTRGKIQLRREPVDLAAVAAQAIETARPLIEARGHRLEVTLPPGPVVLVGDPTRLEQILANLLNNAAKYTEPGGRIDLTAELQSQEVMLWVRDTGIGLSEEMLPRVFDLFSQADRSLDRAQGGLGIGLTLVRSLVELHGGSIAVASAGLGQGSEFTVRLPVLTTVPASRPEAVAPLTPPAVTSLRVLVVDDHKDAAQSLAKVLRLWGHTVRTVHNAPDALAETAAQPTDLVLLDIGLPEMDGYQAARRLRERAGAQAPVLVALTGYGQAEDRHRSREAGFDVHLVKPVDLDDLQRLLADFESLARARSPGGDAENGDASGE
jgi:PAS domain S-box-containing protein